jgi:hypothetical protein
LERLGKRLERKREWVVCDDMGFEVFCLGKKVWDGWGWNGPFE